MNIYVDANVLVGFQQGGDECHEDPSGSSSFKTSQSHQSSQGTQGQGCYESIKVKYVYYIYIYEYISMYMYILCMLYVCQTFAHPMMVENNFEMSPPPLPPPHLLLLLHFLLFFHLLILLHLLLPNFLLYLRLFFSLDINKQHMLHDAPACAAVAIQ